MTVTDFKFISDGPDGVARFEQDANATVLGTWGQDWNHQAAETWNSIPLLPPWRMPPSRVSTS